MIDKFKQISWGAVNTENFTKARNMLAQKYNYTAVAPTSGNVINYNNNQRITVTFHSKWTLELLSRFYTTPIEIISHYIKGPTEAMTSMYIPACTNLLNATANIPTFFIIGTAPSVFKSKQVQQWRELNGGYSTVQDNTIFKRSKEFILGMSKIRKTVIIFVNNQMPFDTARQILIWVLASKMLPVEQAVESSTQNFVKRLTRICAALTETVTIFDDVRTVDAFKPFFDEYWENEDAFKIDVAKQISAFLQAKNEKQLKQIEKTYEDHQSAIRHSIDIIAEYSTKLEEISEQIERLRQRINAGASNEVKEFIDFLERSKTIKSHTFSNGVLILTIDSFLYVNDPEQFMIISRNRLREHFDDEAIVNSYLNAFERIFVNEDYKIRTMAFVQLELTNMAPSRYDAVAIPMDRIPSPHIVHYNCWGAHSRLIAERVKARDLMGVIEQIIEACSGLNVYDSPVVTKFFTSLFARESNKIFVESKTKQEMSLKEIMEVVNETDERI